MIIKEMTSEHVSAVYDIEQSSFTHPWQLNNFFEEISNQNSFCFVALEDDTVAGYVVVSIVLDECNLLDIAVDKSYRRKGVAKALFKKICDIAKEKDLSFVTLEVRSSNESAMLFYQSEGFDKVAVRKNYYSKPNEDAVIMTKFFKPQKGD